LRFLYDSLNEAASIYLFDPKYKSEGDVSDEQNTQLKKIDIDKIHVYRDVIRDQQGNHVVKYAAILYPGESCTYYDGIEAIRAY
jgi:predicted component of viral defense system (DUF524 family)